MVWAAVSGAPLLSLPPLGGRLHGSLLVRLPVQLRACKKSGVRSSAPREQRPRPAQPSPGSAACASRSTQAIHTADRHQAARPRPQAAAALTWVHAILRGFHLWWNAAALLAFTNTVSCGAQGGGRHASQRGSRRARKQRSRKAEPAGPCCCACGAEITFESIRTKVFP